MAEEARKEKIDARTTESVKRRVDARLGESESPSEFAHRAIKRELDMRHDIDRVEQTLLYLAAGGTLTFLLTSALAFAGMVGSGIAIYTSGVFAALLLSGYGARVAFRQYTD